MGKRQQVVLSVVVAAVIAAPIGFAVADSGDEGTQSHDHLGSTCLDELQKLEQEAEQPGGYTLEQAMRDCPALEQSAVPSPYGPDAKDDEWLTDKELGFE